MAKKSSSPTHSRRAKIVGYRDIIDAETGEHSQVGLIEVEDRDFNFHKVWIKSLLLSLDELGNQKIHFAMWLVSNLDHYNRLVCTQEVMAKSSGVSLTTVKDTLPLLIKSNFLIKEQNGVYRVNPNIVFKGTHKNREGILIRYRKISQQRNNSHKDNKRRPLKVNWTKEQQRQYRQLVNLVATADSLNIPLQELQQKLGITFPDWLNDFL